MNGYQLTRRWFDFAFENKEAKPQHTALYCWCVELNNRLGWKEQFGLPTLATMEGLSIGNKNTFLDALKDLIKWEFIEVIQESKNQNISRIIRLRHSESATAEHTALDSAILQQCNSTDTGTVPIVKQLNQETIKPIKHSNPEFDFSKYGELSKLIEDFAKHRKSIKKPFMSQHAVDLIVKKLKLLSQGNYQLAEAIIDEAIANGWQGIFLPKNQNSINHNVPTDPVFRKTHECFKL